MLLPEARAPERARSLTPEVRRSTEPARNARDPTDTDDEPEMAYGESGAAGEASNRLWVIY